MLAEKASPLSQQDARFGLLWLPALGVAARYYEEFGNVLRTQGTALVTVEWRGTGTSVVRAGYRQNWGYRELLLDAAQALGVAQRQFPDRIWLVGGHSMGGQLAALLAAVVGTGEFAFAQPVHGLVLVATGVPYWRLFSGRMRWGVLAFANTLPLLMAVVGYFPGKALRFAGREARGVMRDWRYSALTGRYAARGVKLNLESALVKLNFPVCAIAMEQDPLSSMASLQGLLAKMPEAGSSLTCLSAADLGTRADHFGWLKRPDAIAGAIASWSSRLSTTDRVVTS